jgi:hypothetical protein
MGGRGRILNRAMDPRPSRAELLPELYRAILDGVVELERRGARREAAVIRRSATQAYTVWDERAERRLIRLSAEIDLHLRPDRVRGRGRSWSLASRSRGSSGAAATPSGGDGLAEGAPTG